MWRMHFYTFIQLLCLIILWICKSVQITSLAFPFVLMLIALFRKFIIPKVFQPRELDAVHLYLCHFHVRVSTVVLFNFIFSSMVTLKVIKNTKMMKISIQMPAGLCSFLTLFFSIIYYSIKL